MSTRSPRAQAAVNAEEDASVGVLQSIGTKRFMWATPHRIWLDVKDFNDRARHVYESVGFIFEGTLRDSYFNGEQFESLSVMSILRHEYKG